MQEILALRKIVSELKKGERSGEEKPVLGWTCTYIPLEIFEAAGLRPYRILPEPSSERADAYLDPNFCPFIKTCLGKAIEGGYAFLSGIVMVNTCDGMRRLYDAWQFYGSPPFSFLLDLPRIITPSSVAYFRDRLEALVTEIGRYFDVKVNENELALATEEANVTRSLLRRLLALQGRGHPPLRHGDILDIFAAGWRSPRKAFNQALERLLSKLEAEDEISPKMIKLLLTGSLLDGSRLVRLVEALGAEVVATDICTGGRFPDNVVLSSDPLYALSEAYLKKTPCARMFDTKRRISFLKMAVNRTGAQGLIYFSLKFCDPYLYEAPAIQSAMRKMGIPVLFIEGEYTGRIGGGTRTRVQAFLEMLERNAA